MSGLVIQANVRQIASDTARHEGQFHASAWHAGCSFKSLVAGCRSGPASTRRAPPPLLVLNTRATSNAQQNQWHGQKAARKGWEQDHATGFRVPSQSPAVTGDGCNKFRIGGDGGRGSAAGRFTFVGETTGLVAVRRTRHNEENATQTAPLPTRGTPTTRQEHHSVPTFFTNRLGRWAPRQTRQ